MIKKIISKLIPRISFHYIAYTILLSMVVFSVVQVVQATTPNPGHAWAEVGDGVFAVTNNQTATRTYTFPDANATVLTTNALVTVAQGGIGVGTLASNGILYGNGTGAVQALPVNTGATQCLTQTSSGTPAWGSCGGSSGLTIGTTSITSGSSGRVLYDNAGVVGEMTTSGSGTQLALTASPTFTGTVTIPTSFVLGATTVTTTGARLNYLNAATGTTGTTSSNLVFSTSPTLTTPNIGAATGTSLVATQYIQASNGGSGSYIAATGQVNTSEAGLYNTGDQIIAGYNQSSQKYLFGGNRITIDDTNGRVGIGASTPGALLDVGTAGSSLGVIRLAGSTSGNVSLQPNAVAGTNIVLTLPATSGTVTALGNTTTGTGSTLVLSASPALTGAVSLTSSNTTQTTTSSAFALIGNSITTGTGLYTENTALTQGYAKKMVLGSALTQGGALSISGASYAHTGNDTGSVVSIAYTDASSITAGTTTTNGILLTPTISATGGVTRIVNGVAVVPGAYTTCGVSFGNCTMNGYQMTTPAVSDPSGPTHTFNGFNISAGTLAMPTAAGNLFWNGANIQMPNISQATGTVKSVGLAITGGTVTSGTAYAITTSSTAGNVGFGTTTPAAQLNVLATTEQLRLSYDGSNYASFTTSSGGTLTIHSTSGRTALATGDFFKTSVAGVTGAAAGDIWYDSTAGKYKINEAGTTKTLCNITDGGCGGGSGLTIGTTTITSGSSGRVLYDNGGTLGEMTTSGSGTQLALTTSPSFTTPTLGAATATSINGLTITSSAGTLTIPNNASAALILSGNFSTTLTATATTNVTLPTTGTLATLAGSEVLTNKTIGNTNAVTVKDGSFTLQNTSDTTKQAIFSLSGITTSTTRTLTIPNVSGTLITSANLGNGLTYSSNLLNLNLQASTAGGASSTTSSGSGLEALSGGLAMIQGCADGQILKWTDSTGVWACADDSTGSGSSTTITKAANQAATASSTALQNDSDLVFAVSANKTYVIEAFIPVDDSNTGADLKYSVTVPTGATLNIFANSYSTTSAVITCNIIASAQACTTTVNSAVNFIHLRGFVAVSGTAGNFQFQFAQGTSTAANFPVIKKGATLIYTPSSGADLAEVYYTSDSTILPGDVVSIDPTLSAGVQKSTNAYDSKLFGVVSTKPGLLLSDSTNSGMPVPIALSGRVPVQVSSENGPIHKGDMLTSSSTPGVAMKATKAGPIIGQALEDFTDSGTSLITVFIRSGYYSGTGAGILTDATDLSAQNDYSDPTRQSNIDILKSLVDGRSVLANSVTLSEVSTDRLVAGLEVITPKVVTNDLFVAGTTQFVLPPLFNSDTAGFALIHTGAKRVDVSFDHPYAETPIVTSSLAFTNDDAIDNDTAIAELFSQYVHSATIGVNEGGFSIIIEKPAPRDLRFSWTAIAVRNAKTAESIIPGLTIENSGSAPSSDTSGLSDTQDVPDTPSVYASPGQTASESDTPQTETPSDSSNDSTTSS